jgi:peroxiredoxin
MALTPSTMLPLGTKAPDFRLPEAGGEIVALNSLRGAPALLLFFVCNHCPYVKHVRHELAALAREYQEQGVAVVGISSNDAVAFPADSPELMVVEKQEIGYPFPYLFDESQDVAKAYHAACTPDFYVFDRDLRLVYRGQMDDSRPGNGIKVTGKDLQAALDAVLAGRPVATDQRPSIGCNIKWKPGNEPNNLG